MNLGLTQTEQISDIWTEKSGIFHIFNPLKNQRYEARMGFPAPYQGDFKKQCVSPRIVEISGHSNNPGRGFQPRLPRQAHHLRCRDFAAY